MTNKTLSPEEVFNQIVQKIATERAVDIRGSADVPAFDVCVQAEAFAVREILRGWHRHVNEAFPDPDCRGLMRTIHPDFINNMKREAVYHIALGLGVIKDIVEDASMRNDARLGIKKIEAFVPPPSSDAQPEGSE